MPTDPWGRLSGAVRRAARTAVADTLPAPCGICGLTVRADQRWDLHHPVPVGRHPELMLDPANWTPAHRACNRGLGASSPRVVPWTWPQ